MSRKGVGLAAFDRSRITSAQYASHGSTLRTANAQALETQLAVFRSLLQQFAQTHAKDIRSNPSFRAQFARMCAAIGVDPLLASSNSDSSSGQSIWAQLLGRSVNDFYFELAVRVVEVCGATRGENGGLIELRKVRERLEHGRLEGIPEISESVSPFSLPLSFEIGPLTVSDAVAETTSSAPSARSSRSGRPTRSSASGASRTSARCRAS